MIQSPGVIAKRVQMLEFEQTYLSAQKMGSSVSTARLFLGLHLDILMWNRFASK
jgi:hypothetical protein